MKAAVFEATKKPLVVKNVPDPECAPTGAVIRVEANGVCRSDWHAWSGDWHWMGLSAQPGAVLGHEFCGVVEEVGKDVRNFKKGDRVVVPFSQGDGTCEYCRNGQSNVCMTPLLPGFSYHGGFGQMVPVPFADMNLVALPEECRLRRGGLDGMPLHDVVSRHRRSRAGEARRMGRGVRMRRHRAVGDQHRGRRRRQCHRHRSRFGQARTRQGHGRRSRHQRQEDRCRRARWWISPRAARMFRSMRSASRPLAAMPS